MSNEPRSVKASRPDTEARGETFYQGPSGNGLAAFPPKERWDDWVELESTAWPDRREKHYTLVPTTCFNCESACGLLAYVDRETGEIRKFEGNPEHPGSRGRNCAKGPATLNQITDPDRILYPLRRAGARGEGFWQRVSWDEALDELAARIRRAIQEKRPNEVMYHVGRPGEDGFAERILAAWGVDGHNSHTNICSSSARAGYQFWMGFDRPSPDHTNADVILLISAHLESGHYFNPHAQRVIEARRNGAKLIVFDPRLSNTASHADHWLSPQPGSEAAVLLAIANYLIQHDLYDKEFVRRWWNWEQYLAHTHTGVTPAFADFDRALKQLYRDWTFEAAAAEARVEPAAIAEVAQVIARAGSRLSSHSWRSAASGNSGGWQVTRALFMLNALLGAVATEGGVFPNAWNKYVPRPVHTPPHPQVWNELTWPAEYPLSMNELSFMLPHFLKDGRGRLDVYFTRVYNPVWTNPDGFSWIEVLTDESLIGLHAALTPVWSETAYFADYILPMGLASERHDLHSYETHDAQWLGFRQPVLREFERRRGLDARDTRDINPGEVWEENEFWLDLTWRIDPDGSMGIRKFVESPARPGTRMTIDEYYGYIFEHSVPGLPGRAAADNLTPLQFMRRYGAFEVRKKVGALHEQPVPKEELEDTRTDRFGRVFTAAPRPMPLNIVPVPTPHPDPDGRRPVGVDVDGRIVRGFPTPSGKLEFFSTTIAAWGWPELAVPSYVRSHVHPDNLAADQTVLISTFRLPVQIHTRSANAKWLNEIAHTNPLWIHPAHAESIGVRTGDLVRVETEIGYFVVKAWVTEGIKPGIVACSHHMGRWKPDRGQGPAIAEGASAIEQGGANQMMATVTLAKQDSRWQLTRRAAVHRYGSSDPDTTRIWWKDVGVHQNLTFPVHPDPISGMHCWHQAVRVRKAERGDRYGDIHVDTAKSHDVYKRWLTQTRPADRFSPDGTRRPYWLIRPLKPSPEAYKLPLHL